MCLSDPTPVYPEGEEWEVEPENLRAGHPQEASGFGMLNIELATPAVPQSGWRSVIITSALALFVNISSSMMQCSKTVQCSVAIQCSNTVQCSAAIGATNKCVACHLTSGPHVVLSVYPHFLPTEAEWQQIV